MNRLIITSIFFLFGVTLLAQENTPTTQKPKVEGMQLRANSKDVTPIRRSNFHQPINVRKKAMMMHQYRKNLNQPNHPQKIKSKKSPIRRNPTLDAQRRMVRQRIIQQRIIQQRRRMQGR